VGGKDGVRFIVDQIIRSPLHVEFFVQKCERGLFDGYWCKHNNDAFCHPGGSCADNPAVDCDCPVGQEEPTCANTTECVSTCNAGGYCPSPWSQDLDDIAIFRTIDPIPGPYITTWHDYVNDQADVATYLLQGYGWPAKCVGGEHDGFWSCTITLPQQRASGNWYHSNENNFFTNGGRWTTSVSIVAQDGGVYRFDLPEYYTANGITLTSGSGPPGSDSRTPTITAVQLPPDPATPGMLETVTVTADDNWPSGSESGIDHAGCIFDGPGGDVLQCYERAEVSDPTIHWPSTATFRFRQVAPTPFDIAGRKTNPATERFSTRRRFKRSRAEAISRWGHDNLDKRDNRMIIS